MKEKLLLMIIILLVVLTITVVIIFSGNNNPGKESYQRSADYSGASSLSQRDQTDVTRQPAVAGQFYPADTKELNSQVNNFLSKAEKIIHTGKLKILIVPHAGIQYSGQTAAWAFKQLQNEQFSKVIIIGPSHKIPIDYASVFSDGKWDTPLGSIEIDKDLAAKLIKQSKYIKADAQSQRDEHSIEVQLPFLKNVLGNFKIVPVMVGQISNDAIDELAYKLAGVLDDETLLVISSDLSHYPLGKDVNAIDQNTINGILSGKVSSFEEAINANAAHNYTNLGTSACGEFPIKVALKVAEIIGISDFKELNHSNSADITGDNQRVVGYTAIGAWTQAISFTLSDEAKAEALKLARLSLENYFAGKNISYKPVNKELNLPIGVFVTLKENGQLRGCIGQFEPAKPLHSVIAETAILSATKDPRFKPLTKDDLSKVNIEISAMTPEKKVDCWKNIQLGINGVRISYNGRSGTFLPQVATDNNWDLETFLGELCEQKAGLERYCYKNSDAQINIFNTIIFSEEN